MIILNAKISSTHFGYEDHNILTCWLNLDFGSSGQGFGGYSLDSYDKSQEKRIGTAFGLEFIANIIDVVGVQSWEELKGQLIRVKKEDEFGRILSIGHIIEDKWFDPELLASKYK